MLPKSALVMSFKRRIIMSYERCSICKKELIPIITKIDDDNYESNLVTASISGGVGNKELAKCCEECYEKLKNSTLTFTEEKMR